MKEPTIIIQESGLGVDQTLYYISRYFRILWKSRFIFMGILLLSGLLGFVYYKTRAPLYKSRTSLISVKSIVNTGGGFRSSGAMGQLGMVSSLLGSSFSMSDSDLSYVDALLTSHDFMVTVVKNNDLIKLFYPKYDSYPVDKKPTLDDGADKLLGCIKFQKKDDRSPVYYLDVTANSPKMAVYLSNIVIRDVREFVRKEAIEGIHRDIKNIQAEIDNQSQVTILRPLYGLIEEKYKDISLLKIQENYLIKVIDAPLEPKAPFYPRKTGILLFSLILGYFAGSLFLITWYQYQVVLAWLHKSDETSEG